MPLKARRVRSSTSLRQLDVSLVLECDFILSKSGCPILERETSSCRRERRWRLHDYTTLHSPEVPDSPIVLGLATFPTRGTSETVTCSLLRSWSTSDFGPSLCSMNGSFA